jgi:hypothetical protein
LRFRLIGRWLGHRFRALRGIGHIGLLNVINLHRDAQEIILVVFSL